MPPAKLRGTIAWTLAALLLNALLIACVHGGYLGIPLRLYDHHLLLLLAEKPHLADDGLLWRLVHCHFGSETDVHFRYLASPLVWTVAKLFLNDPLPHYLLHFAAHAAAAFSLFRAALAFTRLPWLALLASALFTVFSAASDTVGIPYYFHLCLATALAGLAAVRVARYLAAGRFRDLAGAAALSLAASLLYDTFFLMAVVGPALAIALRTGSWRAAWTSPAAWILGGSVVALFFVGTLAYSLVPAPLRSTGSWESLGDTLHIVALRAPVAAVTSLGRFLFDGTVFLTGRLPGTAHPGNIPYWDVRDLCRILGILAAGTALSTAGLALLWKGPSLRRAAGAVLCAVGLLWDWRSGLLASLLFFLKARGGWSLLRDRGLAFIALAGYLCALNTAVGRSRFYSLAAIRHHYVTAFFLILGVALLMARALRGGPPRAARSAFLLLSAAVLLNAAAARGFLRDYRETNALPLGFHETLREIARDPAGDALFLPHSASEIRSPDWSGHVAGDWVFDILHFGEAPLTRHAHRARWLWEDGRKNVNPLFGAEASQDFHVRFRLDTGRFPLRFDAKSRYACFGTHPREPHILVEQDAVVLAVTRRRDRIRCEHRLPLPLPANRLFYETKPVSLRREGATLTLSIGGQAAASAPVADEEEYLPWRSDNLDLLGKDHEILLAKHNLFDSYVRIGRDLPGRIP